MVSSSEYKADFPLLETPFLTDHWTTEIIVLPNLKKLANSFNRTQESL